MKLSYDLHIHSALSPCADNDMTPNNIVNMACLKGLDIIAVTDHNSAENIEAVIKCSHGKELLIIPGMEVMTREEVHIVCLFPDLDGVLKFQNIVYNALPDISNRADIFGQQIILNEKDQITGYVETMLLAGADLSIEDVFSHTIMLGGAALPAHVDKTSYSIISNLGTVPEELETGYLEISKNCSETEFKSLHSDLAKYNFIKSSDAHFLWDILERESFIELEEASAHCLIAKLRNKV
ncbi:MAG TPA: PHP domain-containing protein [Clostridiaceae bacterium]|nr:PHP domain-containing protein [Clostridiaceae bacterium]